MTKPTHIRGQRDYEIPATLTEELVEVADDIRQLHTEFGRRLYRVFLVWVRWSADQNADGLVQGDERYVDDETIGAGRPQLLLERELLPPPRVSSMAGVRQDIDATGATERGGVTVDQISMSYTEDFLNGRISAFRDPSDPEKLRPGVQFFYEVQENRPPRRTNANTAGSLFPADQRAPRRKFVLDGTPNRDPDGFEWSVTLIRADGERGLNGEVGGILP